MRLYQASYNVFKHNIVLKQQTQGSANGWLLVWVGGLDSLMKGIVT